ncbi:hypothetical protein [Bacillus velezensis]|uniref:hypothetical protein n=1 Tax=Bacillus velezensis TaxID=492670 RepID=UPI001E461A23|nr:hypothetical protein [Bacillus velezensis]
MPIWRNEIKIKQYFPKEETNEAALNVITKALPQLSHIYNKEKRLFEKGRKQSLDLIFLGDFEELIKDFEWIKESIETGKDPTEFDFNTWTDALNKYLDCLYDLGDTVTISRNSRFDNEKFLWVS